MGEIGLSADAGFAEMEAVVEFRSVGDEGVVFVFFAAEVEAVLLADSLEFRDGFRALSI